MAKGWKVEKVKGGRTAHLPDSVEDLWWRLTRGRARPRLRLKLEAKLYDRPNRTWRSVPGWKLELEVRRLGDVMGSLVACWRGLQMWADGWWHQGHQRPQCQECGEVFGIGKAEEQFVAPPLRIRREKEGEGETKG